MPVNTLNDFIAGLPKAELHCHIEGALEPELLLDFASRNRLAPPRRTVSALRAAYRFNRLQDFLDLYYQSTKVLRTAQDFYDLTAAYMRRAAANNIRHAELFFDPQAHVGRGVSFDAVVDGITAALCDGERDLAVSSRLIMCFLRHQDERDAFDMLVKARRHHGQIAGVGLDSSEAGHPPEKFARVFAAAAAEGYHRVAHAGEEGPPDYIRGALDALKVERIDHGNAAAGDAALTAQLAAEQVPLTMCPLSNLKLGVIKTMTEHPLKKMLDCGVRVTINSDDPAYFGGYLNQNYNAAANALGLNREEIIQLARNSITASFAEPQRQQVLLAEIDRYAAAHGQAAG